MPPTPPCSAPARWWQMRTSGLLLCWELQLGTYSVGFFFFLPVMLSSEIPKLPTDPPVRVFPGVWKHLLLQDSLPGMVSIPNSFVSLFVFYILSYLLLKRMDCLSGGPGVLRQCSEVVLWKLLSIQMIFWSFEFVGEKVVSLSYSSAIFRPPLQHSLFLSIWPNILERIIKTILHSHFKRQKP